MSAYTELYKEYKKLARRADDRLRSLERVSGREGYKDVTRYAYARAQYDIRAFTGDADKAFGRYNVLPAGSTEKEKFAMLQKMMASVKTFLNSETSTIGPAKGVEGQRVEGIKGSFQQRAETTNENYGTSFTWQNMATYWLSGFGKKMADMYGSKTALAMVAKHPRKVAAILKQIDQASKRDEFVSEAQIEVMIEAAFGDGVNIGDL